MLEVKVAQTSEELNAIYQFRYDYFFRTLGRTDILGLDHKKTLHFEELDPYSVHYYIERGGKLLGVLRQTRLGAVPDDVIKSNGIDEIYDLDRFLSIVDKSQLSMDSRLILDPTIRGSLALGTLFSKAYLDGLYAGIEFDFLTAAPNVIDVYSKSGFRRFKEGFEHPENGYDVPMVLALNDLEHLKATKSPLLRSRRNLQDIKYNQSTIQNFINEFSSDLKTFHDNLVTISDLEITIELNQDHALSSLTSSELNEMLEYATIIKLQKGETIIRSNQRRDEMYILVEGGLDVYLSEMSSAVYSVSPGDVVGEMALLGQSPREADITATCTSLLMLLSRAAVLRMMKKNPSLSAKLLFNVAKSLGKKLSVANEKRHMK